MAPVRFIARHLSPLLNSRFRSTRPDGSKPDRGEIGRQGERVAARYLQLHGWRILKRNYRAQGGGEVDLVCRHGDTLVFTEVKTRTSDTHGRPMDAVNADKEHLITRGAMSWLKLLDNNDVPYRFDIVEVILKDGEKPNVNVVENAFQLPEVYRFN